MPGLREYWRGMRTYVETYARREGFDGLVWVGEDILTRGADYPTVSILERSGNGWASVPFPTGPFYRHGLVSAGQDQLRRYRFNGETVVDVPVTENMMARGMRVRTRTLSDRGVLRLLGMDAEVPDGYSTHVYEFTYGGRRLAWAPRRAAERTGNRCCNCREYDTHACCNQRVGYSSTCGACDGERNAYGRGRCVCPGAATPATSHACGCDWDAVAVDNYSTPAPGGFRSLSAEDGRPLWSSSPSGDIPYYLGIEWEVGGSDEEIGAGILRTLNGSAWINSNGRLPLIVKSDSSVSGEEICFSPMSPGAALAFPWDEMATNLRRSGRARREPAGHGVHIHVSSSAFDGDVMFGRWVDLLNRTARPMAEHVARRTGSSWAYFNEADMVDSRGTGIIARASQNGRYSAINANTRHGTHEVRIFRSADTGDQMRAAIAFVAATVDYVRDGGDFRSGRAFRDWVSQSAYASALADWWPVGFPGPAVDAPTVPQDITAADPWAVVETNSTSGGGASSFRTGLVF